MIIVQIGGRNFERDYLQFSEGVTNLVYSAKSAQVSQEIENHMIAINGDLGDHSAGHIEEPKWVPYWL